MSCDRANRIDQAAFRADPQAQEWAEFRAHYPGCDDCAREVAAWTLLVATLRDSGAGSAHPSEERLLAFQSEPERLDASERSAVEGHLSGCAQCRNELAVLRDFDFAALRMPEVRSAAAPSLGERLGAGLTRLAEGLFGTPRPAFALAALVALAVPAALLSWWIATGGASDEAPIAQLEEPRRDRLVEPPRPEPIAKQPQRERIAEVPSPPLGPEVPEAAPTPTPTQVAREEPPAPEAPAPRAPEPAPQAPEPIQIAALLPSELPVYRPDATLVGGSFDAVRVASVVRAGGPDMPQLRALGPEHVGATAEPSPVLYWRLESRSDVPVELSVIGEEATEPLLERRLEPPIAAGLHALSLGDAGVKLAPDTAYLWFVALVPDEERRDLDVVSGAGVLYAPPSEKLSAELLAAGPAGRANVLAQAGYWYDAFATVGAWIEAEPDAQQLRVLRATLLSQVGLD